MDRKALSKRLEGLSSVFASGTPIATDLAAMAYTLDKMADDKFKDILAADIDADKVKDDDKAAGECSNGCNCNNDGKAKEASSQGLYWSREASDVVLANLVKDVTGAVLTKEQTPDGEKKAVKPATLKEEQTPSISKVLDSDIVTKSHGSVVKSASEDDDEADGDAEGGNAVEAAKQDAVQPATPQPGDIDGNDTKTEKEIGSMEDMAQSESKNAFVSEGVELSAPMIEVSLGSKEAADLSRLFD